MNATRPDTVRGRHKVTQERCCLALAQAHALCALTSFRPKYAKSSSAKIDSKDWGLTHGRPLHFTSPTGVAQWSLRTDPDRYVWIGIIKDLFLNYVIKHQILRGPRLAARFNEINGHDAAANF